MEPELIEVIIKALLSGRNETSNVLSLTTMLSDKVVKGEATINELTTYVDTLRQKMVVLHEHYVQVEHILRTSGGNIDESLRHILH